MMIWLDLGHKQVAPHLKKRFSMTHFEKASVSSIAPCQRFHHVQHVPPLSCWRCRSQIGNMDQSPKNLVGAIQRLKYDAIRLSSAELDWINAPKRNHMDLR